MYWRRSILRLTCLALVCCATNALAQIDRPEWLGDTTVPGMLPENPHGLRIEINIPALQLTVFERNQVVAMYPVAIGALRYPSPTMSDESISRIEWNPSWYPPKSPWAKGQSIAKPGPRNPLGAVKLPIARGILVHGTNKPHTVGTAASHGCFRMRSDDVTTLAWYLQERASSKTDPALFESYAANRYRTRVVRLDHEVPVDIVYETVQIHGGDLHIYPDIYGRADKVETEIANALTAYGYPLGVVTDDLLSYVRDGLREGPVQLAMANVLSGDLLAHADVPANE